MGKWIYRSRFLDFGISLGEWSASHPGRFTPGIEPPVSIGWEAGWSPEPVWMTWRRENSWLELRPLGRPVASRYTDSYSTVWSVESERTFRRASPPPLRWNKSNKLRAWKQMASRVIHVFSFDCHRCMKLEQSEPNHTSNALCAHWSCNLVYMFVAVYTKWRRIMRASYPFEHLFLFSSLLGAF
jgi:hypothetical protein